MREVVLVDRCVTRDCRSLQHNILHTETNGTSISALSVHHAPTDSLASESIPLLPNAISGCLKTHHRLRRAFMRFDILHARIESSSTNKYAVNVASLVVVRIELAAAIIYVVIVVAVLGSGM